MFNTSNLKIRIVPILLLRKGRCVKGVNFENYRDTGNPIKAAKVYDSQKADELIFLDITASGEDRPIFFETISKVAEQCFMPFTAGGGIRTLTDIRKLVELGSDKVSINTGAIEKPDLITAASQDFGSQCVVVSIDAKKTQDGKYEVYSHSGKTPTGLDPTAWAKEAEKLGAGEILLTSIDKEGTRTGYDLELIRKVSDAVDIPVIANGGVGNLQHLVDGVVKGHASAVALASMFHFTDQSTIKARAYMKEAGLNVRPDW
ncbi:MAG: glycosyl amidation-associated protein WbuZ [Candidatus Micrarchaeia archaeon]